MIIDVETAQDELEQLIELAKGGEEVLIRDGDSIVRLVPIFGENKPEPRNLTIDY